VVLREVEDKEASEVVVVDKLVVMEAEEEPDKVMAVVSSESHAYN